LQDLGAAGITCSVSESAARVGMGADLDLDLVPLREQGLEPFEILTSESQEGMLAIVAPERLDAVREVCERWGLASAVIATLVTGGMLTFGIWRCHRVCTRLALASDGPSTNARWRPRRCPRRNDDPAFFPFDGDLHDALIAVLSSPNVASKRWVFEQYDSIVQGQTVAAENSDAAVFAYRELSKGIVVSTDGKGRFGHLDPYIGAMHAVAEAGAERCRHGSPAARHHELHELRQPGTAGRDVAVRRVDPRDA